MPEARLQRADGTTYATIDLTEAEYRSFYVGFANGALWPLLHFRLGLVEFRREDYEAYRGVNRRFAESLARLLRDDDLIWVHDYHLFPLAEELRRLGVRNRIGFFLHTPFVPPALLHALPRAAELLRAMCAYRRRRLPHAHLSARVPRMCAGNPAWHQGRRRRLHLRRPPRAGDRRSDRHRCRRLRRHRRPRRAQRRDDAAARKPGRPHARHRRRSARLFQGPGQSVRGVRPAARQVSRASTPGQLPADRGAVARGVRQLSAPAARARSHRGRHQRPLSPNSTGCRCAT